jgi:hypothetical protein
VQEQPVNELSPDDCEKFDGYVKKWQSILNLSDWRIERGAKRAKKSMAEVTFDPAARLACYRIGVSFGSESVTDESLERTALHLSLIHI